MKCLSQKKEEEKTVVDWASEDSQWSEKTGCGGGEYCFVQKF